MNPRNTVHRYGVRLLVAVSLAISCFAARVNASQTDASVLVQHAPSISGRIEGDIQFNEGGSLNLNSGAEIIGSLSAPGSPSVRVNGNGYVGEILEGIGNPSPSDYKIHVNGSSYVDTIATRTDPSPLSPAVSPIGPTGHRHVNLNSPADDTGDFATIKNLNINSAGMSVHVPPGAYGNFNASNGSEIVLGIEGSSEPAVYSFDRIHLNGSSKITLVGKVVVDLGNGFSTGGSIGNQSHPEWLLMNVSVGGVNLNNGGRFYGVLKAPEGHVNINSNARLEGALEADRLNLNGSGVIVGNLSLVPDENTPPIASSDSVDTQEDQSVGIVLGGSDLDGDTLSFSILASPANGSLSGVAPNLTYTPDADYFGSDAFTFSVNDGQEESNIAVISILVESVNDIPTANSLDVTTLEDAPVEIRLSGQDVESADLVFAIAEGPSYGVLDLTALPRVRYVPNQDSELDDSFSYTVSDGEATSEPATVTISVTPVNDAPGAVPLEFDMLEDNVLDVTLEGSDAEGNQLVFEIAGPPSNGSLQLKLPQDPVTSPDYEYTPDLNWFGVDSFSYRVFDGAEYSDEVSVLIDVQAVNDQPVAVGDSGSVLEDGVLAGELDGSDVDEDSLSFVLVTNPENGSVSIAGNGNFEYTPDLDYFGNDTFAFAVSDGELQSDPETFTVVVSPVNDSPVAVSDTVNATEDVPVAVTLVGTDVEGDPLSFVITNPPAHGSLSGIAPDLVYTPNLNYSNPEGDSFSFIVNDGELDSQIADVEIAIASVNDVPSADPANLSTSEDELLSGVLTGSDIDGDVLTFNLSEAADDGVVSVNPDGSFTYLPNPDFFGSDIFTFTVSDGASVSTASEVSVSVIPVNDAPTVEAGSVDLFEDAFASVLLVGEDVDGDDLSFEVVSQPSFGTLSGALPTVEYTPELDFFGVDFIEFRAYDGSEYSEIVRFDFNVISVNDTPVANPDNFEFDEDTDLAGNLTGSDVEGTALSFALVTDAINGTVSINVDGSFSYTPDSDYFGTDSVAFSVSDGVATSVASTVDLTIRPVNDLPIAADQAFELDEDTSLSGQIVAGDVDGDALTFSIETPSTNGNVSMSPNGLFDYTPDANFDDLDVFGVRVEDPSGAFVVVAVSLTVAPVNDAPTADPTSFSTDEDVALNGSLSGSDIDGDSLNFSIGASPSHGSINVEPNGEFSYLPDANYHGSDSFTFTVSDGVLTSAYAAVSLTVNPINDAPTGNDQDFSLDEDTTLIGQLLASDLDGDALIFSLETDASNGVVSVNADGNFEYTPNTDFDGSDLFQVRVADPSLSFAIFEVSLTVNPINDAPVALSNGFETDEDTPLVGVLAATDAEGDTLTFALDASSSNGTASVSSDGSFNYTPNDNYSGSDSFTFTASDGTSTSDASVINITINPINDAPVAFDSAISSTDGAIVSGAVSVSDVDSTSLSASLGATEPSKGSVIFDGVNFTYSPNAGESGADSFSFVVNDGSLDSNEATVSVTLTLTGPTAYPQNVGVDEDSSVAITLTGDYPQNGTLAFSVTSAPANGTLGGEAPNLIYTPEENYFGADQFSFTVSNGDMSSAEAVVSINVVSINDLPTAIPADVKGGENTPIAIALRGSDVESSVFGFQLISPPSNGQLSSVDFSSFGTAAEVSVTYAPEPGFFGYDSFTFIVNDGEDDSDSVKVWVEVEADPRSRTYTEKTDFEEGSLFALTTEDSTQLTTESELVSFDYLWIPNYTKGSIQRMETETARIVGEYNATPYSGTKYPSRVMVDSDGAAWVANYQNNSIIKILPPESSLWTDRNGNGKLDTSMGIDDVFAWEIPDGEEPSALFAEDELIVAYIETDVRGLRHLSIDAENNVWVGGSSGPWQKYDGYSGELLTEAANPQRGGFGGIVEDDVLYSGGSDFLVWDLTQDPLVQDPEWLDIRSNAWGIAKDSQGNLWVTKDWDYVVHKYSPEGELLGEFPHGDRWAQGIAIGPDDHVWIAHSHCGKTVGHLLPDGTFVGNVQVANHGPTEVSVDRKGYIWVSGTPGLIQRINPLAGEIGADGATPIGEVDLQSAYIGGTPWTYGTFTGQSEVLANPNGLWRTTYDSGVPGATWGEVVWNAFLCNDADIVFRARAGDSPSVGGEWTEIDFIDNAPDVKGRYLEIEAVFVPAETGEKPVLYDLTVGTSGYDAPVPDEFWTVSAGENIDALWPDPIQLKGALCKSAHPISIEPIYHWEKLTGSGVVTFDDSSALRPNVTFSIDGDYTFRLTATYEGEERTADVSVHLVPYNKAPWVDAGGTAFVGEAFEPVVIQGVVRDDGLPLNATVDIAWTKKFGPGNVGITEGDTATPTLDFDAAGIYLMEVTATDGEYTSSDTLEVRVDTPCSVDITEGLVSWWQANCDGIDHVSANVGFLEGGMGFAEGKVAAAFDFDGVDDRMKVFASPALDVGDKLGITWEFWIRPDLLRDSTVVEFSDDSGKGASVSVFSNDGIRFDVPGRSGESHSIEVDNVLSANVWTHVTTTWSRVTGEAAIYINGVPRVEQQFAVYDAETRTDVHVGADANGGNAFDGRIDELTLYCRALRGDEVWQIFDSGDFGKCPPSTNEAPVVYAGDSYLSSENTGIIVLEGTASDDGLPLGDYLETSWEVLGNPVGLSLDDPQLLNPTLSFTESGIYTLRLTAFDGERSASHDVEVRLGSTCEVPVPDGIAGWWRADDELLDQVSYEESRAPEAGFRDGVVGRAFSLGSYQTAIHTPSRPSLDIGSSAAGFSIELWLDPDVPWRQSVLEWVDGDAVGLRLISHANYSRFEVDFRSSGLEDVRNSASGLGTTSGWKHVAAVYDRPSGELRLYIDGVLGIVHDVGSKAVDTSGDLWIGGRPFGELPYYEGGLDELSLYDRPLTQAEVVSIFSAGAVGKCPLDGNQLSTILATSATVHELPGPAMPISAIVTDATVPSGILSVDWALVSGPNSVSFGQSHFENPIDGIVDTDVIFPESGVYVLEVTASDGELSVSKRIEIFVTDRVNLAPNVDAGLNQTITQPENLVQLAGFATDDGVGSSELSYSWSSSDPGKVSFEDSTALDAVATIDSIGEYVLTLEASDGDKSSTDTLIVNVLEKPNEAPSATIVAVTGPDLSLPITLSATVTDDGFPLDGNLTAEWRVVSGPGTVSFSNPSESFGPLDKNSVSHAIETQATVEHEGVYVIGLSLSDGSSLKLVKETVEVFVDPVVKLTSPVDGNVYLPNATIPLWANAYSSGQPVDSLEFFIDGASVGFAERFPNTLTHSLDIEATTLGSINMDFEVYAVATDARGRSVQSETRTIFVIEENPALPVASIEYPTDSEDVKGPVSITGTAQSSILVNYVLDYRLSNDGSWTRLSSSADTVPATGELGTLDPSMLLNGIYEMRLVVTDLLGRTATDSVLFVIDSQLKIGNLSLAFEDLSIPVSGIPMQVVRSYDSRDASLGDFGNGWQMALSNMRIQKNRPVGRNWMATQEAVSVPFFGDTIRYRVESSRNNLVLLRLPDDSVAVFKAVASPAYKDHTPLRDPKIAFEPLGDTLGSLEIVGDDEVWINSFSGETDLESEAFAFDVFDPKRFKYTTEEGQEFVIDEELGLLSMTDRNGNTLTISDDGVTHSSGLGIAFTRDAEGRITAITDPEDQTLSYAYDAQGRLETFTNRASETFTYLYENPDFPNYLTDIVDPDGKSVLASEFDADGRLASQTDANGESFDFIHDIENFKETVVDRLGVTTVHTYDIEGDVTLTEVFDTEGVLVQSTAYEYDTRGNETKVTDSLGNVTERSYDGSDNLLSETKTVSVDGIPTVSTTAYTYDSANNPLTITDALGNATTFVYDASGNLESQTDALENVTQFSYDASGNLESITDPLGNQTVFTTSLEGYQTSSAVFDADGVLVQYQSFEYNSLGRQLRSKDYDLPEGATEPTQAVLYRYTDIGYDGEGRQTSTVVYDANDVLLTSSSTDYDSRGQVSRQTDALGRYVEFGYDGNGNRTQSAQYDENDALLSSESWTYDAEGRQATYSDVLGRLMKYDYAALGRQISVRFIGLVDENGEDLDPSDNTETHTIYDSIGRVEATVDERGKVTLYEYDENCGCSGRRAKVIDPLLNETVSSYDLNGNQTSVLDANGHLTLFEYDELNRPTRTTFHNGTYTETVYDALGRRIAAIDQNGLRTDYVYDALGRLVEVQQPAPADGDPRPVTHYEYDSRGNQISQIDAEGRETTYEYDELGRRVKRILPELQEETYQYDMLGNLIAKTDFNGYTTVFEYDEQNRLVKETADPTHPSLTHYNAPSWIERGYDVAGNLLSSAVVNGQSHGEQTLYSETRAYDERSRITTRSTPEGTLSYAYDASGNLESTTSSNADGVQNAYAYDDLNRLESVDDGRLLSSLSITSYGYDDVGNLDTVEYGNGFLHDYSYDTINRLANLVVERSDTGVAQSYAYTLGEAGNRKSVVEASGRASHYVYDDLYRLTKETILGAASGVNGVVDYGYDQVGNRTSRSSTLSGVGGQSFTYDDNDRLDGDTYDANGNTLSSVDAREGISDTVTDVYDFRNRLIRRIREDGQVITLTYDADGNRVGKQLLDVSQSVLRSTSYLVDLNNQTGYAQVVEERLNEGTGYSLAARYTYGHDLISQTRDAGTSWYLYDGHGSVRALVDETETVTDEYEYDAFGILLSSSGATENGYLYTGEQYDADLGMYFLRARYLNAGTGRFHNMDTYEGRNGEPLTLHKYLYAHNNPVVRIDPSGNVSLIELQASSKIRAQQNQMAVPRIKQVTKRLFPKYWKIYKYKKPFNVKNPLGGLTYRSHSTIKAKSKRGQIWKYEKSAPLNPYLSSLFEGTGFENLSGFVTRKRDYSASGLPFALLTKKQFRVWNFSVLGGQFATFASGEIKQPCSYSLNGNSCHDWAEQAARMALLISVIPL